MLLTIATIAAAAANTRVVIALCARYRSMAKVLIMVGVWLLLQPATAVLISGIWKTPAGRERFLELALAGVIVAQLALAAFVAPRAGRWIDRFATELAERRGPAEATA
ncbi:MAG: hypothetical protein SF028_04880 [Candidatus Sumerlaeia bacterium]|nr:hypothetical protein [Candidatus Sumerlaeia bacterium]